MRPTLRLVCGDDAILQRHEFDQLDQVCRPGLVVERIRLDEVPELLAFAARELPVLSSAVEAVVRVVNGNRDSVWVFRRGGKAVGVYAMLHLSGEGLEALLLGEFNTSFPDRRLLVATEAAPAAIYKWAVVAPGMAVAGIAEISRMLRAERFATANLYARPTTLAATRLMANLGFRAVRCGCPDLQRYVRLANRGGRPIDRD